MPKFLTDSQVRDYHAQGFLSPVDIISEDEAASYLRRLEWAEETYPDEINPTSRNNLHLAFRCLDELAFHPLVLDAVEDLLGADFSLWGTVLFAKEAQSDHFVSWHQDATYMGMNNNDFVTPWIALTPSNREMGCMSMIPGSHRDNIRPHDDTYAEDNILTRGQVVRDVDERSAVDLVLRPGQMSLHHGEIIHGSRPNLSRQRRVGFALQSFMPHGVVQTVGRNQWLHARGEPRQGDVEFLRRPQEDTPGQERDAAGAQLRATVNENFSTILYHGAEQRRGY